MEQLLHVCVWMALLPKDQGQERLFNRMVPKGVSTASSLFQKPFGVVPVLSPDGRHTSPSWLKCVRLSPKTLALVHIFVSYVESTWSSRGCKAQRSCATAAVASSVQAGLAGVPRPAWPAWPGRFGRPGRIWTVQCRLRLLNLASGPQARLPGPVLGRFDP